ncbi:dihydroneopterin aldolase [Sansalvadorimonas verongulae]|uniref:dihydroneopterin aldolase n=1 Tax=Sansalvadorimonas verongulae TaxID=2172824 RepID=UPI0018AD176A|nr:dihydroneopterin aldolase [Sansalvadorimonas verongulae]
MDKVLINDLYVESVIGFYHWEHEEPQPLIIDLELGTNFTDAFTSDDLEDALNYAEIRKQVKTLCQESRFHLLERLAGEIVNHVFTNFPITDVRLNIRKPHALRDAVAAIETYRTREQMGIALPR